MPATVIPFPLARRIESKPKNVACLHPTPYGPIIDALSSTADHDGTALPSDTEPWLDGSLWQPREG